MGGFGDGSSKSHSPISEDSEEPEGVSKLSEDTSVPTSTEASDTQTSVQSQPSRGTDPKALSDIDANNRPSPQELSEMLMDDAYHDENPQVPYAMWRNGTSTGRDRITIELNSDVSDLEMVAMGEFKNRYDADINKADLREFALVYGLTHLDDVFKVAEEWGLQYNG